MKECPTCKLCFSDSDDFCPADGNVLTFVFAGNVILEDRYKLEQCIGRGGMGIVYRGRHLLLKTLHAIKVILPELAGGDPGLVRRFRQEAMVAASIRHQNIVTVTDFGVVGEKMPFIVMDFIKGELLHDLLEREGRLAPSKALEIITAVGAGVGTAHQQGIIHRDLKPLNIILQDNLPLAEGLKILDFGLAKIKSGDVFGSFVLAQTTGLMGSPYYMAPEQWSEEEPDTRADIYSIGIILYQMLAGVLPFRGPSVPVIMKKHMFDQPPAFSSMGADVPPKIDSVVRRCLEKDPANRPQTVEELITELRTAVANLQTTPITAQVADTIRTPKRRSTRASKDKAIQSDPTVRSSRAPRSAKANAEDEALRRQAEQDQLLQQARARAEEETRKRAEQERLLHEARAQAEAEARKRAEQEKLLEEARIQAEARRKQAEQERLLQEARAKAEAEERNRAEHERLLAAERERAEAESKRRAELEQKLHEERARAEAERRRHEDLANRFAEERQRADSSGDNLAFPPSTLAKLDETNPPQSFHPLTLPQMSLHPEAFIAASNPTLNTETSSATHADSSPYLKAHDTMAESIAPVMPVAVPDEVISPPPPSSRTPLFVGIGVAAVLLVIAVGVGIYLMMPSPQSDAPTATVPAPANMVSISGGKFLMGREIGSGTFRPVEGPPHEVTVSGFFMDKTEVTSSQYSECVKAGDCRKPREWKTNDAPVGQEQWPVTGVSFFDAQGFASWRSKKEGAEYRLPSEDEWEFAARSGNNENLYPWGKTWADGMANLGGRKALQPVGSFVQGASSQGVLDLIGSVWEWTSSKASKYPNHPEPLASQDENKIVIRGGSYGNDVTGEESVTAASRRFLDPSTANAYVGFRLVRSK